MLNLNHQAGYYTAEFDALQIIVIAVLDAVD